MCACKAIIDSQAHDPLTQYIITRRDLPLGTIAAQVAHAAGSGSERHPDGTYVVVLSADTEESLRRVAAALHENDVAHTEVCESDAPYAGQLMAIGLELVRDRSLARKVLSCLPLLRTEAS